MVTDPIADLLVRIQNAARRGQETVSMPASKLKGEILRVLKAEGFIGAYEKSADAGSGLDHQPSINRRQTEQCCNTRAKNGECGHRLLYGQSRRSGQP